MASISSAPPPLSRFRPALYVVGGVAAAYAVIYLHRQYVSSRSRSSLRRRGAIHRRHSRRRGGISLASGETGAAPDYAGPITHLDVLERESRDYGVFRGDIGDGRVVECHLIPSQLVTAEQLQETMGITNERASLMRLLIEESFMNVFLTMELSPSYTIQQENGEWQFLTEALVARGLSEPIVTNSFTRFNQDDNFGADLRGRAPGEEVALPVQGGGFVELSRTVQPPDGGDTNADDESIFSWRDGNDDGAPTREGQNLLNLLYYIAEDQARRDGYIHRGVTCNSCGTMPIQGIRYRCANCIDFDLCETCEALGIHIKTHLFYKVRIPAPFLGNPRQSQPVWYPGRPMSLPRSLPRQLAKRFMKETNFENTELDALWDQFRCLANVEWFSDPNNLNMAIDRKTFDRCFVPNTSIRPPPPSLIYDRMFSFYDTNGDNLIGFEEFLKGLASFGNKSVHERLKRIFEGYDMDRDGYVERKDFLRIFRAYYTLSRELTRDMISGLEDDWMDGNSRDIIMSSQPISSAFAGNIPPGETSRIGEGKRTNLEGDMEIVDNEGILREDEEGHGDINTIIGDAAVRDVFGRSYMQGDAMPAVGDDASGQDSTQQDNQQTGTEGAGGVYNGHDEDEQADDEQWPPSEHIEPSDVLRALHSPVPLDQVTNAGDRARIREAARRRIRTARVAEEERQRIQSVRDEAVSERWARRPFYLDEEDGAAAPAGYNDDWEEGKESCEDIGDVEQSDSHVPSPRSRSSSKVRFQDDVTDNEYETRSNPSTSSRSIPVGERWGGFEVPEVEKDVGKEILYQVTQQGLNELLDLIFKPKEDLLMEAYRTRADRKRWAKEIQAYLLSLPEDHELRQGGVETETGEGNAEGVGAEIAFGVPGLNAEDHTMSPRPVPLTDLYPVERVRPQAPEPDTSAAQDGGNDSDRNDNVGDIDNGADVESFPPVDPTLPQNRPDESDVEAFPPVPEAMEDAQGDLYESAEEQSPPPDPTLPQNRPDRDSIPRASGRSLHVTDISDTTTLPHGHTLLERGPVYESASSSTSASAQPHQRHAGSSSRNQSLPFRLRFQHTEPTSEMRGSSPSSASSNDRYLHYVSPPRQPAPETLAHYCKLNQIEREAKERGGSGAKLSFEEFAMTMQGDKGRRLGFVGTWIDMTSF